VPAASEAAGEVPGTPSVAKEEHFDLQTAAGFEGALKARIGRPFLFGPVEFEGLSKNEEIEAFDFEAARELVINQLNRSPCMP